MKTHEKFLEFNGKRIVFLSKDGTYWIALKPICEALELSTERYLKRTKRDHFFKSCLDILSMQVSKNGKTQSRKLTCMPEQYIYGWICSLNSDDEKLTEYKKTCYELLYNHFHGTITNRKELLIKRKSLDTEIFDTKAELKKQDEKYKHLQELQTKRKTINTQLNSIDKELIKQPNLFGNN